MNDVFNFRDTLINEYATFSRSFTNIDAADIKSHVEAEYERGRYWPEPLIQINPNYQRARNVEELVAEGILHPGSARIFRFKGKDGITQPIRLFTHQQEALTKAKHLESYVVTTGTGSGKSLAFFIPIIDQILRQKEKDPSARTRAIIIYPMNALANSQLEEVRKFLANEGEKKSITVERYTGQEDQPHRKRIADNPPDILLTNFMMLELILTRFEPVDRLVVDNCRGLEFLVLDELHTYRGRQGADVALLVRRLRERFKTKNLICIGTSATMSSTGSQDDRKQTVAEVASKLFGQTITSANVIDETLERATNKQVGLAAVRPLLKACLTRPSFSWESDAAFAADPLSIWVELNLGLSLADERRPQRAKPRSLTEAAELLARDAGLEDAAVTKTALSQFLNAAQAFKTPEGRSVFAFKLHQFISGPGKVLCTLEQDGKRLVTLDSQVFAPGRQEERVFLFSTHFCRECGQEYHPVWQRKGKAPHYSPREIDETAAIGGEMSPGFLMPLRKGQEFQDRLEDFPDAWIDNSAAEPKLKPTYRAARPIQTQVSPQGDKDSGRSYWFIPGKFRFCLKCGMLHEAHGRDINRLAGLSGEGRSSATTVLTLSILRQLFEEKTGKIGVDDPRKILGFTDNRQDAALQAGHFNDFVFLLLIRAGLLGGLQAHGGVLEEDNLSEAVFDALGFDSEDPGLLAEYLRDPGLLGNALAEAQKTLRFVIGYRLIRDLRKGWRYNNPNLNQLELLEVGYKDLEGFAANEQIFEDHDILKRLNTQERCDLARLIFGEMTKNLCIESRYLDGNEQEKVRGKIFNYLAERWAFADDEILSTTRYLVVGKRPDHKGRTRTDLIGGGQGSRLLRLVKFASFWAESSCSDLVHNLHGEEWVRLLNAFLTGAARYGFVECHELDNKKVKAWTLKSSVLQWTFNPESDPGSRTQNRFFRELYLKLTEILAGNTHNLFDFVAHEHTAQVDGEKRKFLEQRFRRNERDLKEWESGEQNKGPLPALPVMYCSPTMELGVDISSLNTVYLRNIPPTPANYAQRSGRGGRSGQAALIVTYCAAMSPHDQWFFHHANQMVHGIVKAPTLDLANEDLVKSHLHAVWLAQVERELPTNIAPILDLEQRAKPLVADLQTHLEKPAVGQRALEEVIRVLAQIEGELTKERAPWFVPDFAEKVITAAADSFSKAFDRWRSLYDAVQYQMEAANKLIASHVTGDQERKNASYRYAEAKNQFALLLKTGSSQNNDFYLFRYLASQGFLPGYNFPRLPLMAWIPSTGRKKNGKDDQGSMVSRPRFLALSEFGPRSLIYHEGRMFRVDRAKLNVSGADSISSDSKLPVISARVCTACGYGHLGDVAKPDPLSDVCEHCGKALNDGGRINSLYRIENVETRPEERISVNDEERQRQGYDLQTTYRFMPGQGGKLERQDARVMHLDKEIATLTYSPAARIWRVNKGWRRRKDKEQLGFYINPLTGKWSKEDSQEDVDEEPENKPAVEKKESNQLIVPYVEDYRNILILQPKGVFSEGSMATLQSALKRGITQTFQIEESELVVEALPDSKNRRSLLFYEASEGGAGVLSRLAQNPDQLAIVARTALEIMHFRPPNQGDFSLGQLIDSEEKTASGQRICEAGCYQCLLSYFNQPDHEQINRRDPLALPFLLDLAQSRVSTPVLVSSGAESGSVDPLTVWMSVLTQLGLRLPDQTLYSVADGLGKVDALYKSSRTLVFLFTPSESLLAYVKNKGFSIICFPPSPEEWPDLFAAHPSVFGEVKAPAV